MVRRPFFVGVGAQRSGTTWVGHFLRDLPDVRFSPIKEICYFDSKHVKARTNALHQRINTRLAVLGLGNYTRRHPISGARLVYHYLGIRRLQDRSFRAFFDELARQGHVAGEISPSYAMLDVSAIEHMDRLLDEPNYFFIMRNPVDRLVSQYSFLTNRRGLSAPAGRDLSEALLTLCGQSVHTDYGKSLNAFRTAVPEARFKTFFTEHLFASDRRQTECDELCDFLGVGRRKVLSKRAVNRAPEVKIEAATRTCLVKELSDAYIQVAELFGDDLPSSWRKDLALLGQV